MKNSETSKKQSRSKRMAMFAAPLLVGATLLSGLAIAPAQAAGDVAPAKPVAASETTNLQNSDHGSLFEFMNRTGERMEVNGRLLTDGYGERFKGADNGNDWSGQAKFPDGTTVDLHANNPRMSEAYFQVGPHKVYKEAYVVHNGKHFHVNFKGGSWDVGDKILYKAWDVTCTGSDGFYTHEFVHHRDKLDGAKGTVTNKTEREVKVRVGGAALALKPGQRLLYFDAHAHQYGNGFHVTVQRSGSDQGAFAVEAVDPSAGLPQVTVVTGDGAKDKALYSQHQSKSFTESGSDFKLKVTRQGDHKLPTIYENYETSDWAVFDIDITNK